MEIAVLPAVNLRLLRKVKFINFKKKAGEHIIMLTPEFCPGVVLFHICKTLEK